MKVPNRFSAVQLVTAVVIAAWLPLGSGCRTLVPYDSHFMCDKNVDFGKCQSVSAAYEEALAGPPPAQPQNHPDAWQYREGHKSTGIKLKRNSRGGVQAQTASMTGHDMYKDAQYRQLAQLLEAPATPLVRPPKTLRTLIVSYPSSETLYMPRYIIYFAEEARFVLGDYLNQSLPRQAATVYPNGAKSITP